MLVVILHSALDSVSLVSAYIYVSTYMYIYLHTRTHTHTRVSTDIHKIHASIPFSLLPVGVVKVWLLPPSDDHSVSGDYASSNGSGADRLAYECIFYNWLELMINGG